MVGRSVRTSSSITQDRGTWVQYIPSRGPLPPIHSQRPIPPPPFFSPLSTSGGNGRAADETKIDVYSSSRGVWGGGGGGGGGGAGESQRASVSGVLACMHEHGHGHAGCGQLRLSWVGCVRCA